MPSNVLQTVQIGAQWPTIDPFLFCAHHDDAYPAGNGALGPAASLEGRELGMDFEGADGWRMYHGQDVPGFPQHPHRGFETVTYVRRGLIDHSDSLGAAARFGRGDVQWLTAGSGIVHSETFPLVDADAPNPLELFQIWLNLAPEDKLVEPHFSMLWSEQLPRIRNEGPDGAAVVTVIAGELAGQRPPAAPPSSWASREDSDVAIWHVALEPGARWSMPPARSEQTVRTLYCFAGTSLHIDGEAVPASTASVLAPTATVELAAGDDAVDCMLLQGRPIGAPVAKYGPFVMNTEQEIQEAFADYRRTGFGGWPWDSDEPVNAVEQGRFARHPDGTIDEPGSDGAASDGAGDLERAP